MILAISRAERFSPNSVEKDAAILECVAGVLRNEGYDVGIISETAVGEDVWADVYLSMGRLPGTLAYLSRRMAEGAAVVNSPVGVSLCCDRRRLTEALRIGGVPVAPVSGNHGYWLKRASGVAESRFDVQYAATASDIPAVMDGMKRHGIADVMVCAHVEGDLLKFYGVRGTGFFRHYYPGDDGQWKFGDERRNGRPHHYAFDTGALRSIAAQAAAIAGVDVYGGDCIIGSDGSICLIDFNDWPSFSRCRDEAAGAIARLAKDRMGGIRIKKREWQQIY